jgi:nicotinate phosphoribosyltransferase
MKPGESVLLTDLYELTMARAYHELGMQETAVFELFVRKLPPTRRFLIAAGLEQVIEYLEALRFTPADLEFLASLKTFPSAFLDYLATVRFTGSLHAMPEGTPFFANEPIVCVAAPILEAQLVESRLLNLVHFQSVIASKAVRCVSAARGKRLVDFGMRRAHGEEAALYAARAAYLAGFDATATVEAGRQFGIPLSGTMAHSFIQAHDSEEQALRNFVAVRGRRTAVLIDTYDTERAAHRVAKLAREFKASQAPGQIQGVRIDSGDLGAQAHAVRRILDAEQCQDIEIILSGSLDEHRIEGLLEGNTPVDAFGIGTRLDVSEDAPSLDMAYKLEEYAGKARRKRSIGKATWPGRKQVFRDREATGTLKGDSIALATETQPGEPLLQEFMRQGRRIGPLPTLTASRAFCRQRVAELPAPLRTLTAVEDHPYPVAVSDRIRALADSLDSTGE